MYAHSVTYKNYNGAKVTKVLYFHLTRKDAVEIELETPGGIAGFLESDAANDPNNVYSWFLKIIMRAYGEKSEDGEYFIRNPEVVERFIHSAAFEALFNSLVTDAEASAEFFTRLIPQD